MTTSTTATSDKAAELGPTFRAARKGAGVSLRALCARAEVEHSHVSRWERGERRLSEVKYQHISGALADYIAGRWTT